MQEVFDKIEELQKKTSFSEDVCGCFLQNYQKMNNVYEKVYIESGIKNRKDIKLQLAYTGEYILLMILDYIWGGDAKYETIKSYPFTMNVDDIVKDVKEIIAKSEPIKGSSLGDLMRKNRKDK